MDQLKPHWMSPRQVVSSALATLRDAWQTWLLLSAIVLSAVGLMRNLDLQRLQLNNAVAQVQQLLNEHKTIQARTDSIRFRQDSVLRWRANVNALFCSSIYPERQQQAYLLGLCLEGIGGREVPFVKPPTLVRPQ